MFDEEQMQCMIVVFPRYKRQKGQEFLGAVHGLFGVLQMILQAAILIPELVAGEESQQLVNLI